MIKLKWNFPNINYDRRKTNKLIKMKKYGLHASEVDILEEAGEI